MGSGKLAMLAGHVRGFEGEEIEWTFIKVHPKQFLQKEKDKTGD